MRRNVGRLFHHLAVPPDAVARQVGADVEVEPERGDFGIADVGHADDRTRLRVELAEAVEIARLLLGKDGQITLHKTIGDAGSRIRHAGAAGKPRLEARQPLLAGQIALRFPV